MHLIPIPIDEAIKLAESRPAAYVLAGASFDYFYRGAARDLPERFGDHRDCTISVHSER